jgi:hypothetical protein
MRMEQTNNPRYRAAQLGALLARFYQEAAPHMIARVVFDLQAAAKSAVWYEMSRCNGDVDEEKGSARLRDKEAKLDQALASLGDGNVHRPGETPVYHATVELGGDPRGSCASLHIPHLRGDGFGDGFSIY